jgi:CRP-like cAMP-binding protein
VNKQNSTNKLSIHNRLLAALPAKEYQRLLPNLEEVALDFNTDIYKLGETISHVYFPNSGIISLLAAVDASSTLEVGLVGSEGMAGLPLFMGVKSSPVRAIVQGNGIAMRMKATDFVKECKNGGALSSLMLRFAHSMLVQISQSAVCYRFHRIEQRLARWLLMTGDRMESNEYQITQEFLSHMLGVRREAVNKAAGLLQKKDLISFSRRNIVIIDRPGLEAAACKCYFIIREEEKSVRVQN